VLSKQAIFVSAIVTTMLLAAPTLAQAPTGGNASKTPERTEQNGLRDARAKAIDIGSQPARDVGMVKREIPPILQRAYDNPYSLKALDNCAALEAEIVALNGALGPDFDAEDKTNESRNGKMAEAGGKMVVNSLVPFRGLVREITGAAPADRHLNNVVDAGFARRGFLRGVHLTKGCQANF